MKIKEILVCSYGVSRGHELTRVEEKSLLSSGPELQLEMLPLCQYGLTGAPYLGQIVAEVIPPG